MSESNGQKKELSLEERLEFLEALICDFANSEYSDQEVLKYIVFVLADVPMYFPVDIDTGAMLGSLVKAGDALQLSEDVKMRFLTVSTKGMGECVPMFSTGDEVHKGPTTSVIRLYPQDYLPKLIQMDKPAIVNPFSEFRFFLSKDITTQILWPIVQKKTAEEKEKSENAMIKPPADDSLTGSKTDGKDTAPKKGLFGSLFGKNSAKDKLNPKVEKIYEGMNNEYREKVFYGDVISANHILTTMTRKVFGAENDANIDLCFEIYLHTWIRAHGGLNPTFCTPSYIQQALRLRFSSVDSETISRGVTHALSEIYEREPKLKERADAIELLQNSVRANARKNTSIENLYLEDQEYGLVPGKPIFVNGFGNDREYLSHLCTDNGEKLSYKRIGSSQVPGIAGPVDLYRLILPNGQEYLQIFMCNYGSSYKKHTPKGVKYID